MLTILATLFYITNTMLGITRMHKIVLKLYISPNVNRTDRRPYEQGQVQCALFSTFKHSYGKAVRIRFTAKRKTEQKMQYQILQLNQVHKYDVMKS